MLTIETPFPHAGAQAFLRPDADPCRIVRHNAGQGTVLVLLARQRADQPMGASTTRTVPLADLAATHAEALPKLVRGRRTL